MDNRVSSARSLPVQIAASIAVTISILAFVALGCWQLERRTWKLELIDTVQHRIHAVPMPAPGPAAWSSINASRDAFLHVSLHGMFLNDRETLVHAVTDAYGNGYWVMTPMQTDEGFIVLVNRGFIPSGEHEAIGRIAGQADVIGLLRMTEPKGGFLRPNDSANERWYSRDVAAIAATRGLSEVAPYFVDADSNPNPGGLPIGGLTVIAFPNNHLVYALTWFGLAALLMCMVVTAASQKRLRSR